MMQEYGQEDKKLWWVRYIQKRDLEAETPQQRNAFFYAVDEEALRKDLAGWQRYIKHEEVIVQTIEQVPSDFRLQREPGLLQELPASGRIVQIPLR
jgi:hypothetical protein